MPATDGGVPSSLRERIEDPVLRAAAATRAALGLGVVFAMVVKPGAIGAVVIFALAFAVGVTTMLTRGSGARGALAGSD